MTVAKKYRIPRENIKLIFRNGQRLKFGSFQLVFLENNLSNSRIAVVIPAKAVKKSVLRNKFRRKIKEIFKKTERLFGKNYDLIFIVREAGLHSFKNLEKHIFDALFKAKII